MTEIEAIKWLKEMQNPLISEAELYCAETYYGSGKMVYPEPEDYVFETAIQALEEIQQYRAIGTIEELQALKEKNEPKEPDYQGDGCWDGHVIIDTWICPSCGKHYEVDYDDYDYCPNCGQHIDHSGLTEDD